eukprot:ANDGO_00179.mRNA.1 CTP-dependent diacylglycerol kinase 1
MTANHVRNRESLKPSSEKAARVGGGGKRVVAAESKIAEKTNYEFARKLYHVLGLPIAFVVVCLKCPPLWASAFLALVALHVFVVDVLRLYVLKSTSFNERFFKMLGPVIRESEKTHFNGMLFYFAGASLSVLLFDQAVGVCAIFLLAVCDPIASIAGKFLAKHSAFCATKWFKANGRKTLGGSLGSFSAGFVVALAWMLFANHLFSPAESPAAAAWSGHQILYAAVAALAATLAEAATDAPALHRIDDNLLVPICTGLAVSTLLRVHRNL